MSSCASVDEAKGRSIDASIEQRPWRAACAARHGIVEGHASDDDGPVGDQLGYVEIQPCSVFTTVLVKRVPQFCEAEPVVCTPRTTNPLS